MWRKVEFVLRLAKQHGVPILIAGDIGLKPQWPSWLEEQFISLVRSFFPSVGIFAIPGQHDLPNHNLELWKKSSIGVLHAADAIVFWGVKNDYWPNAYQAVDDSFLGHIFCFPYGVEMIDLDRKKHVTADPTIAMVHTLVTEGEPDEFLKGARSARSMLNEFSGYDLIISGDNHKSFVTKHEGRLLVNPGSLMRTTADQVDHRPRVYLWYGQDNSVEPVYLPIDEGVISRDHIDDREERDVRIEAYVDRLSQEVEIGLSFESNLEAYFRANRTRNDVADKVWSSIPK
jgi:DNA repair exonuclease SbcCD nuclease subunit